MPNSSYTDKWKKVQLIPVKGKSKRTHMKLKHPKDSAQVCRRNENAQKAIDVEELEDNDVPDLIFPTEVTSNEKRHSNDFIDLSTPPNAGTHGTDGGDMFVDLTENDKSGDEIMTDACEQDDVIVQEDGPPQEFVNIADCTPAEGGDIPELIYWESVLGTLESCENWTDLENMVNDIKKSFKPLPKRSTNVHFRPDHDYIDANAAASLPPDGPKNVHAIWTKSDGNCLTQALSISYSGTDDMHIEIRVRIIMELVQNKSKYLDHVCLSRGATYIREEETLQSIYAKYSDHYINGQRITSSTIDYLYCKEVHDCTKMNSYMELWQLAAAASALNCPVQSVYHEGGDNLMRLDFHRVFFPVEYTPDTSTDNLIVMWTSCLRGHVPVHFVPLLPKCNKYAFIKYLFISELIVFHFFQIR